MGFYTTKVKSRKWVAFVHLSEATRVKSSTILAFNLEKDPTIEDFRLTKQLIIPLVERRSLFGLGWVVKQKISLFLGRASCNTNENNAEVAAVSEKAGRCHICMKKSV